MTFHLFNAIWGDKYTDLFLNVSLPTQLSTGNLPAFNEMGKSAIYKIYTTEKDADTIRKSPVFAELLSVIPVQVIRIKEVDLRDDKYGEHSDSKYGGMVYCHRQATIDCIKDNGKLVSLISDAVYPHQFFTKLINIESTGKLAIMIFSYRVLKENFVTAITKEFYANNLSVAIPSRDLVKFSLDHLHPYSQALFWDATDYNTWPSHIYWNIKERGLLARCFNLHPIMLNLRGKDLIPQGTVDGQYWEQVYPNISDIYIAEDTDELFAVEMSSLNHTVLAAISDGKKSDESEIAQWAISRWQAYPVLHAQLLKKRIRVTGSDVDDTYGKIEADSDQVIGKIYSCWADGLRKAGRLEEALTIYRYAVELCSKQEKYYQQLGDILEDLEQWDEAIDSYMQVLQLNPEADFIYCKIGAIYGKQSKWEDAILYYKKAIELDPNNGQYYYILGVALQEYAQLNLEKAIAAYHRVLELNPEHPEAGKKLQQVQALNPVK